MHDFINIQDINFTVKGVGYHQELHSSLKWNRNSPVGVVLNLHHRRPMNNIICFPIVCNVPTGSAVRIDFSLVNRSYSFPKGKREEV